MFSIYEQVKNCWVARKPGGLGFVEMEQRKEAKRAVSGLNGNLVHGFKVSQDKR